MRFQQTAKEDFLKGPQGFKFFDAVAADFSLLNIKSISIHFTYSFSGIINGLPNEKINSETLLSITSHIEKSNRYGLPIHISPIQYIDYEGIKRLPFMFYVIELESDGTDEEHAFSSLLYVSFRDNLEFSKINSLIEEDLKSLEWGNFAKNWSP